MTAKHKMTDAEISKPAPKERSNSQNSLNSESTKKIIEASKKRELNLKEQNILLQTENEIWKKKYSNLEQNLLSEISKYRQEIKNFSFERDELNWTIKILKRQNFESTNEIELYSNLKRESETKYVNAVNKQKELKIELDQSFEEVTKLNQIILDVKRKNLELNELIEGMSKGYLSEKYDLLKTELEEKNKIINNLIEENENYKKEKASLVFKDLADHNHEINDLNGSLIEDMGLLEKKYNDLRKGRIWNF